MAARHGYKVGERLARARMDYLGWIDMETGVWGWSFDGRAGAVTFPTKRVALAAAEKWEIAIRIAGHTPGPIVVVPAHGGVECSRR